MSAYIVEDKTINRILAGIEYTQWGHCDYAAFPYAVMGCKRNQFYAIDRDDLLSKIAPIGHAMRSLNEDAVRARYDDADERGMIPAPYVYNSEKAPSLVQLYKSLHCLLYQCSEGDVPEHPLFQALETWTQSIADKIVFNLPEFRAAEWG